MKEGDIKDASTAFMNESTMNDTSFVIRIWSNVHLLMVMLGIKAHCAIPCISGIANIKRQ